jgi:hypothetical protein
MVLLAVLAIVLVLTIIAAGTFWMFRFELRRSQKQLEQDRAVARMEAATLELGPEIESQLSSQASVELPALSLEEAGPPAPSEQTGFYTLSLSAQFSGGQIVPATQMRPALLALQDPDDPFRGAQAVVELLNVTANANRIGGQRAQPGDPLSLGSQPVIAIRQIPVSQFSVYSWTDLELDGTLTPDSGRVYSLGDVTVNGLVRTDFPLGAASNINLAADSGLEAHSDPDAVPVTMQVSSTADPEWPALAKSVNHSTILSGRDLPMGTASAATIAQLTAPPWTPSQGPYKDSQRLYLQCSRVITENEGVISVSSNTGSALPSERGQYSIYNTENYKAGPVIVFDYAKVAPNASLNSFYFASTNPNAVVLVRNVASGAGLSIVTPHLIYVAGGFNSTGSLITASGVAAVPASW